MEKVTNTWRLHMTTIAPLIHGSDEKAGNMSFVRQVAILDGQSNPVTVPAVSGNSLRGKLRRVAARQFLAAIGVADLPLGLYHLFFSGGSIEKGSNKIAYDVETARQLRQRIPFIGLFGGSYQNDVFPSSLDVEWIWPVCKETSGITGVRSEIEARSMIDQLFYTRHGAEHEEVTHSSETGSVQMIFESECIIPGVKLCGAVGVERGTELEVGCLASAIEEWAVRPQLGGKGSVGHGLVRLDEPVVIPGAAEYRAYLQTERESIREFLQTKGARYEQSASAIPAA